MPDPVVALQPKVASRRELVLLTAVFWLLVAASAIRPVNPRDYLLEIAAPILGFALLAATSLRFRFTPLAYRLMLGEAVILIVGAHYTHEKVPAFDWLRDVLGTARNDYDRLAHFAVGFLLVVAVREIYRRSTPLVGGWLALVSVTFVLAFAAFYEITEWWIAVGFSPETATAYLGSQGDPWDGQKDMLLDGVGALVGLAVFGRRHDRQLTGH